MTSKKSAGITRRAKRNPKTHRPLQTSSPSAPNSVTGRQPTGICFFCLMPLTAMQPGGTDVRHLDQTPYGQCPQAKMRSRLLEEEYDGQ